MKWRLAICGQAIAHHKTSRRAFAHIFHKRQTICVAPDFLDLPETYQAGILLHELGHAALSSYDHSEAMADRKALEMTDIAIERRTYRGAKNLEVITLDDLPRAKKFLRHHICMRLKESHA